MQYGIDLCLDTKYKNNILTISYKGINRVSIHTFEKSAELRSSSDLAFCNVLLCMYVCTHPGLPAYRDYNSDVHS